MRLTTITLLALLFTAGCEAGVGNVLQKDSSAQGVDATLEVGAPPVDLPLSADIDQGKADSAVSTNNIYVAAGGADSMTCGESAKSPCATITRGISRAATFTPPRTVVVAAGSYYESLKLVDQVSIKGGYSANFSKGPGTGGTSNIFGSKISGEAIAVKAENLTRVTELVAFTVQATDASGAGKSSYGVFVEDSPNLVLRELKIISGKGAAGTNGSAGTIGEAGIKGGPGFGGKAHILPPLTCGTIAKGAAGWNGDGAAAAKDKSGKVCGQAGGDGGKGETITPWSCSGTNGKAVTPASGAAEACGAGNKGKGGKGGKPGKEGCDGGVTEKAQDGFAGCKGKDGAAGTDGKGGKGMGSTAKDGTYAPADGVDGGSGKGGQGGGGGGGGGGYSACSGLLALKWGGGGGGGGAGGCSAIGGTGGKGGGASIGIYIAKGYTTQKIINCSISSGKGGAGGKGGKGAVGGLGGIGGAPGKGVDGGGAGGAGGEGGAGGAGGGGGGGGGGAVVGIYIGGGASPATSGNTYTMGTPGAGGKGAGAANGGAAGKSENSYGP